MQKHGPVIPLHVAAQAAGMSIAELKVALGPNRVVIVSAIKLGVTPSALEAVAPGASAGLTTFNPVTDVAVHDLTRWG